MVPGESENASNTNRSNIWASYEHISKLLCLPTAAGDNGSTRRRGRVLKLQVHSNKATRPLALWIMFSVPVESTSEPARARNDKICRLEALPTHRYIPQTWWMTRIKFTVLIKFIYLKRRNWDAWNFNSDFDSVLEMPNGSNEIFHSPDDFFYYFIFGEFFNSQEGFLIGQKIFGRDFGT